MCGRFTLHKSAEEIKKRFSVARLNFTPVPRYNIAPTQPACIILQNGPRSLDIASWGLIPSWSDGPSSSPPLINARSETLTVKQSFRDALAHRRCLVPADGFYEWKKIGNHKYPYYFKMHTGQSFAFAGLWDHWQSPEGSEILGFAIITVPANGVVGTIHDRMPAILNIWDEEKWLDHSHSKFDQLQELLKPLSNTEMTVHPVSEKVNSYRIDSPSLIHPIADHPKPLIQQSLF